MFFRHWDILLVDDEPDVLQFSKLAMKNFRVYGVLLRLHTAASKAEAIELLIDDPELSSAMTLTAISPKTKRQRINSIGVEDQIIGSWNMDECTAMELKNRLEQLRVDEQTHRCAGLCMKRVAR